MKQLKILFTFLFFGTFYVEAQVEQAWVFFTEKPNVTSQLESPEAFLSERAILRKQKYTIEIDERDVPLEQAYIDALKNNGEINFLTASKWFNAAYVEGSEAAINALIDLSFVDSLFFMNKGLNTSAKFLHQKKFNEVVSLDYGNTEGQIEQIQLNVLHNLGFTGEGMLIGVMDSGFVNVDTIEAFENAWENNQIIYGYDAELDSDLSFDASQDSHGTSVLSTMLGNIDGQFVGSAIDAQYALFKTEVTSSESPKEEAYWIAAAEKADSLGVDILNTSLGYSTFENSNYNYTTTDMDGETTFISQGASIALQKGMLPVVSAGNDGNSAWQIITAPADSPSVLSIGAVDINGNKASFSSIGSTADGRIKPDVVALGADAVVVGPDGFIGTSNGTSFSAPIMAGAVACLWQAFPDKNAQEIMQMVKESGHLSANPNNQLGYGIPDFSVFTLDIPEYESYFSSGGNLILKNTLVDNELEFLFSENQFTYKYYIYSLEGQLLKSAALHLFSTINVDDWSSGLYFFKLEGQDEATKFIKK